MLPGIRVPSDEQKQSGIVHWLVSHSGARFGSKSTAIIDTHTREKNKMKISLRIERNSIKASESIKSGYLLQAFSSDSSLQSGLSLQNNSFSIHSPLPHCNLPSGQTGSSVLKFGIALRGSLHFQCVYK